MAVAENLQLIVTTNATQAIAGLDAVAAKVQGVAATTAASMGAAGKALTKGLTLPIMGLATMGVKSFKDFDGAMTQSLAIMGDAAQNWRGEMEDVARKVALTTTLSATEAAESYFFLASAGMDAEQSIAALPAVAAFAQAGMFDMAKATDLATDAQSALGLKSADAQENLVNLTRVTDVFVRANTLANATVEQFSSAMTTKAGVAARALGKDVEETTAILSVMADAGVKGEAAGTQLAMMLNNLGANAVKNADKFREYGVTVFDSSGEMRNMADIVADMSVAFGDMSDEAKIAAIMQMGFGDRAAATLKLLLGQEDAMRGYESALRDASGFTADVAAKQLESFDAKWKLMKNTMQDVAITIGQVLLPPLTDLLQKVVDFVKKFRDLDPEMQKNIIKWAGLAAAIGPALVVGSKLLLLFSKLNPWMLVLAGVVYLAKNAMDKLGISFEDIGNAIQPALDILAALGKYFMAVVEDGDTLNDWLSHLPGPLQAVAQLFGETFVTAREVVSSLLEVLTPIATAIVGAVIPALIEIAKAITPVVKAIGKWVKDNGPLMKTLTEVGLIALGVFKGFKVGVKALAAVKKAITGIGMAFKAVMATNPILLAITAIVVGLYFLIKHWDKVVAFFKAGWEAVTSFFKSAWETMKTFWQGGVGGIKTLWESFWANIVQPVIDVFTQIWEVVKSAFEVVVNIVTAYWKILYKIFETAYYVLKHFATMFWDWVSQYIEWAWDKIMKVVNFYVGIFTALWDGFWKYVVEPAKKAWDWIVEKTKAMWQAIQDFLAPGLQWLKDLWNTVWGGVSTKTSETWENIKTFVQGGWDKLVEIFETVKETVSEIWNAFWDGVSTKVGDIWEAIKGKVSSAVDAVKGYVTGMVNTIIESVNKGIEWLNKIPNVDIGTLPLFGGKSSGNERGLADGGIVKQTGLFKVGERGPETVRLPAGSEVRPGASEPTTIVIQVGDQEFARYVLDKSGLGGTRQAVRTGAV